MNNDVNDNKMSKLCSGKDRYELGDNESKLNEDDMIKNLNIFLRNIKHNNSCIITKGVIYLKKVYCWITN